MTPEQNLPDLHQREALAPSALTLAPLRHSSISLFQKRPAVLIVEQLLTSSNSLERSTQPK
jgi:hypothetical protein